MLHHYIRLCRLDKPIGIYLLLWPTLWAIWLASKGAPSIKILLIFILGVVIMRSLGCVLNDIADRKIDPLVKRTATRPLARQDLTVKHALKFAVILAFMAASLLLLLPYRVYAFAIIAIFLTMLYPYSKRFIKCPQLILGLAFAWSIPMVYLVYYPELPRQAWHLFAIAVVWPIIYDTQYAMTDKDDDLKIGVNSSAIWFGSYDIYILATMQIIFIIAWLMFALYYKFKYYFFYVMIAVIILSYYQHCLVCQRERYSCFKAFCNNKWQGLLLLLAVISGS